MKKQLPPAFWVTNRSNRNVTLADLALNIPAFRTVNLMDTNHYYYTLEQLKKSAQSGSLFKKRDKMFIRMEVPDVPEGKYIDHKAIVDDMTINREAHMPSRERSTLVIKEEKYEELNISDEEYASENADTAEMDQKPIVIKG